MPTADADDFIASYNHDLALLGCDARVAAPAEPWHRGSIRIFDGDGDAIGIVPHSVEPFELAAFVRIVEDAFRRGRQSELANLDRDGAHASGRLHRHR